MMFQVGDEVTTRRGAPTDACGMVVNGEIYTVSEVWIDADGTPSLWFKELPPRNGEWGYYPEFFRKVQKRSTETGMAILRGLLNPNPVKRLEPSQSE